VPFGAQATRAAVLSAPLSDRRVIAFATHWAVESLSAQQLVARTFAHQAANRGASRAESLRHAQLYLVDGRAGGAYAHPFFWAPYALYGDPVQ